jgi:hypothetical protein
MAWMEFNAATEEEIEAAKAEREQARVRSEVITARVLRLIAEELTFEQLEAFHAVMSHIANSQSPAVIANWYEGMAKGSLAVRDLVLGQKLEELP